VFIFVWSFYQFPPVSHSDSLGGAEEEFLAPPYASGFGKRRNSVEVRWQKFLGISGV
jgi:hypothetical protein